MPLGAERTTVQNPLIRYATEVGWTYLPPDEALRLRRGEEGAVLYEVLVQQLQRLNPGVVDLQEAERLIGRLIRLRPAIEGNLEAWEYLRGLKTAFVEAEHRERNVRLLDPEQVEANIFQVTDEFRFHNGTYTIKPDIVFLVNGIPVLIVETKAATELEGIAKALDQIRRYHREGPELLALLQLHSLTHLVQFFYGPTWNLSRKVLFNWRDEQAGDFETLVKSFVAPRRILRLLTEYILFVRKEGELSKAILRPHQMRAAERVVQRAKDPAKRRGLIWHTQGSGKTYTMITVAKRLLEDSAFQNPTVLMLVDRNELESQLFDNLGATLLGGQVKSIERPGFWRQFGTVYIADSRDGLRQLLMSDTRGLIVTLIHKFDAIPANLNERENIFVLVDEAHRTTGGDLGNYLMGALPNATYVGFTGTPIDKTAHGKGTFKVFGVDDHPKGYLDKYSIRESIQDGTTVPLHYALAPNDLLVDRETLEREFLSLAELEGVSEVEELNRVLERAVTLANMLKNPKRMAHVAAHVARHFRETVEPMGYKAFLVAVDREACARYKRELDHHLPPEYSAVVISPAHNDSEELARFHLREDQEQELRKAFCKPDHLPKIFIVTEKLLTGFDASILYCMYLDKPMRDHVLLQAIARVNRPYEDDYGRRKPAGFVLDFVGIFDKLERALAFDSEDVQGVIEGIEVLRQRFTDLMAQGRSTYLSVWADKKDDKAAEAVLEHFRDRQRRQEFYRFFRELEELYEILSPDAFLRPFLNNYDELTRMYRLVRSCYEPHISVDKSFLRKTAYLVQEHTQTSLVCEPKGIYKVDADTLEKLAGESKPDTVKVFNLIKVLHELVAQQGTQAPYLIDIGERAERIAQAFEEGQLSTQQALQQLEALVREYQEAEQNRQTNNFSREGFAVFWLLKREKVREAEQLAREAAGAFEQYPHWRQSAEQEREVRKALYKVLLGTEIDNVTELTDRLLSMLRRSSA